MKRGTNKNYEKSQSFFFQKFVFKLLLNKYSVTILLFLVWMVFFDSNSFLVIHQLNQEIDRYEKQRLYYKTEYEKSHRFYNQLMNDKEEKEKFSRENYFMKKPNEEIFILVSDSTNPE
ncbi:MAG: septum formation initiator family protein [Bergeyella sp.]|nr:septum formation initiator family protein [Bergeyella sp.]